MPIEPTPPATPAPAIPTPPEVCAALVGVHDFGYYVRDGINTCIEKDPNAERVAILKLRVRPLLDTAAYIWQAAYNLEDGYLYGGGGNKPPLDPTDTSNTCGLPSGS